MSEDRLEAIEQAITDLSTLVMMLRANQAMRAAIDGAGGDAAHRLRQFNTNRLERSWQL